MEGKIQIRCVKANPWPYNPGESCWKLPRVAAKMIATGAFVLVTAESERVQDFTVLPGIDQVAASRLVSIGFRSLENLADSSDATENLISGASLDKPASDALRHFRERASAAGLPAALVELGVTAAPAAPAAGHPAPPNAADFTVIKGVGAKAAAVIAQAFGSLEELAAADDAALVELLGSKVADSVAAWRAERSD